jgi:ribosomal protein S2
MKKFLKKKVKKIKNNNPKKILNVHDLLINFLFKSKNFYGELLKDTNPNIIPFLYGIRYNYTIINLKNVSFYLKRIFKLLKYILSQKKNILIIGNSSDIEFLMNHQFIKNHPNIIFFNQKWIHGLITNNLNPNIHHEKIELIIIIKSSIQEKDLKKELSILNIPIISLMNTSQNLENINYPIISNTKNVRSLYILMYLLRKIF